MTTKQATTRLSLMPLTSGINEEGKLTISGYDTVKLATEYGTPLYVFDDFTLRRKCTEFTTEFGQLYDTAVIYACKAFINKALLRLLHEMGLGLDVVSGGEIGVAQEVGFPMEKVYFHGNNKSPEELGLALESGVGRIVVDNFYELDLLNDLARQQGRRPEVLLRLSPGIDPHTHKFIATGVTDSKFGFPRSGWEEALIRARAASNLDLIGLHTHLGSLLFDPEPYVEGVNLILDFAAGMKKQHGFILKELNIGGGFAVQYTLDLPAPPVSAYAKKITTAVIQKCQSLGLVRPRLIIEPGRAIVAQGGVALYRVGAIKDIPGVRRYVSLDGGMADNIRPALYDSKYEAIVANRASEKDTQTITLAGKFCESGDILIKDISLPPVSPGDIIAIPDCGAYCLAMASNYNASFKPAIVLVKNGQAQLIRRRETVNDLTRCDLG